jgi:nucleoid DNA-binding protein
MEEVMAATTAAPKKPMGKTDLIDAVAKATTLEKTKVKAVLETALDTITKELKRGMRVQLTGFGTFSVAKRKKRMGVNPKTGAKIAIPARKVPKFTPGKALKDVVGG